MNLEAILQNRINWSDESKLRHAHVIIRTTHNRYAKDIMRLEECAHNSYSPSVEHRLPNQHTFYHINIISMSKTIVHSIFSD